MKIFGLTIAREKANVAPLSSVDVYGAGGASNFFGLIRESFAGAWQRNIEVDCQENLLAFSAVFACVSLISDDIAKLRIKLTSRGANGTWVELSRSDQSPFLPVLTKPNRYQTRIQFLKEWVTMKLIHGNAYILKERDARNVVVAFYVLDSRRVRPLIAPDGSVYYEISQSALAGVGEQITVPAAEMIHDRGETLWHPLVGVTPIYACGSSATQGNRIQANSSKFFENMSRPSGQLTAPGAINNDTASRLKKMFEDNFSSGNIGRLFVAGDGLKYEPMTIPASDAQLIEQLRWTVEDVCRCFHVPLHKMGGGQNPTFNNVASLNQDYYNQALQLNIESIELLLDEALGLPALDYGTELDLDGLLRMDPAGRATANKEAISAGYLAPNEARQKENLPPVKGGETPYMQQQNWPLAQLADRPPPSMAPAAPFGGSPAPNPAPKPAADTAPDAEPVAPASPEKDGGEALSRALIMKFLTAELDVADGDFDSALMRRDAGLERPAASP